MQIIAPCLTVFLQHVGKPLCYVFVRFNDSEVVLFNDKQKHEKRIRKEGFDNYSKGDVCSSRIF